MTVAAGTRLGPYEILTPLGAGGMGEVYRRLRLLRDLPLGHRAAARPDADSTASLVSAPRSGSRGASRFARLLRETLSRREWL
ncbi:MAG TPA: hypothetical protein VGL03_13365 [Thermoanaerobaculia bacterium]|jgi:hypothetical protein